MQHKNRSGLLIIIHWGHLLAYLTGPRLPCWLLLCSDRAPRSTLFLSLSPPLSPLSLSLSTIFPSAAFHGSDDLPGFLDRARNVAPDYHYYRSLTSRELALICTRRAEEPGSCRRRVSRPKILPLNPFPVRARARPRHGAQLL